MMAARVACPLRALRLEAADAVVRAGAGEVAVEVEVEATVGEVRTSEKTERSYFYIRLSSPRSGGARRAFRAKRLDQVIDE